MHDLSPNQEGELMLEIVQRVLKGLAAAASAALASYGVALADGTVTAEEWITLAVAAIGAGLVVWAVPNKPAA
jgi:peptidoglycan/LPS O-acetylase OafA/YrhL